MDSTILKVSRKVNDHTKKDINRLAVTISKVARIDASILAAFAVVAIADLLVKNKVMLRSNDV